MKRTQTDKREKIYRRKEWCVKGVMTIELAYLLPVIFLVFSLTVYAAFYYHDKNIMAGLAGETAILGVQKAREPGQEGTAELERFFQERISGKLILFSGAQVSIIRSDTQIEVIVSAQKGAMKIQTVQRAAMTRPEETIRKKRRTEQLLERRE